MAPLHTPHHIPATKKCDYHSLHSVFQSQQRFLYDLFCTFTECMLVLVEIINPGCYKNILTLEKQERRPVLLSNILCPQRLRLCCVILLDLSRCIDYDANLRQVCKTLLQIFLDLGHFFFRKYIRRLYLEKVPKYPLSRLLL